MKLLYHLFFLLFYITATGQQGAERISGAFPTDSIHLDHSKVLQTSFHLQNNTSHEVRIRVNFKSLNSTLQLSGPITRTVELAAGNQMYLPVSAIYHGNASHPIAIVATIEAGTTIQEKQLVVLPAQMRHVIMTIPRRNIPFTANDSLILFQVRISNSGTTDEDLHCIVRWPEKFQKNRSQRLQFHLKAATDTVLYLTYPITTRMRKLAPVSAVVSLYYNNDDYIRSEQVILASVRNQHRYQALDQLHPGGTIGLSTQYMSYNKELTYRMHINQQVALSDSATLSLDAHSEYWGRTGDFYLRNSTLTYADPKVGIRVGSLYQSGELSTYGRGVGGSYAFNDSLKIQAGWLDKSFSLTDPLNTSRGSSFWLHLSENKAQTIASTFYFDTDRLSGANKYILYHTHTVANKKNLNVNYSQGLSMLSAPGTDAQPGILASLNSYYTVGKFSWSGTHQVGSPHYAGMRRGMMLFQQKLTYRIQNHLLDLSYNYYRHRPKSVNALEFFGITTQNQQLFLSYRIQAPRATYHLGGYYQFDSQDFISFKRTQQMEAARFQAQAHYRFFDDRVTLGAVTAAGRLLDRAGTEPFTFRSELLLQYGGVRLSAHYQYNYHNIYETLLSNPDQKVYEGVGLNVSGNHSLFGKRMKLNWGINYTETPSYSGMQWNSRINWELPGGWEAFAGYYNNKSMLYFTNQSYQLEVGMVKKLSPLKLHEKNHRIIVQLFYNEGAGELVPAGNRRLSINGYEFISDLEGFVHFTKVPTGECTFRVANDESWMAPEEKLYITSDTRHSMVLNKTTAIQGIIHWEAAAEAYDVDRATTLFVIKAVNAVGKEYRTYTNSEGRYALFVPEDQYLLSITPQKTTDYMEIKEPTRHIRTSKEPVAADFNVLIKSRTVETKKFNSVKF
ncbi:MAG: hypothetical protein RSE19_03875 [Myroides sp.]